MSEPHASQRLLIFGNAGAGKTTLARYLVGDRQIPILCLDQIAWDEPIDGIPTRLPLRESIAELEAFIELYDEWIVEGCYGDLVQAALPYCTELHFLNPGIEVCVEHCDRRPWEADKFNSPAEQAAAIAFLIDWVKTYETRDDEYGLARHRSIFDHFTGQKIEHKKPLPNILTQTY